MPAAPSTAAVDTVTLNRFLPAPTDGGDPALPSPPPPCPPPSRAGRPPVPSASAENQWRLFLLQPFPSVVVTTASGWHSRQQQQRQRQRRRERLAAPVLVSPSAGAKEAEETVPGSPEASAVAANDESGESAGATSLLAPSPPGAAPSPAAATGERACEKAALPPPSLPSPPPRPRSKSSPAEGARARGAPEASAAGERGTEGRAGVATVAAGLVPAARADDNKTLSLSLRTYRRRLLLPRPRQQQRWLRRQPPPQL